MFAEYWPLDFIQYCSKGDWIENCKCVASGKIVRASIHTGENNVFYVNCDFSDELLLRGFSIPSCSYSCYN